MDISKEHLSRYRSDRGFRQMVRMIAEALWMDQSLTAVDAHHAVEVAVYKMSKQLANYPHEEQVTLKDAPEVLQ